jgi:hypothetical protein
LKNTHSPPQPKKKKKKKRKRSNTALDDDNPHPRKSARNDTEPTPRMELEEAAVRAPDVRICLRFLFLNLA